MSSTFPKCQQGDERLGPYPHLIWSPQCRKGFKFLAAYLKSAQWHRRQCILSTPRVAILPGSAPVVTPAAGAHSGVRQVWVCCVAPWVGATRIVLKHARHLGFKSQDVRACVYAQRGVIDRTDISGLEPCLAHASKVLIGVCEGVWRLALTQLVCATGQRCAERCPSAVLRGLDKAPNLHGVLKLVNHDAFPGRARPCVGVLWQPQQVRLALGVGGARGRQKSNTVDWLKRIKKVVCRAFLW